MKKILLAICLISGIYMGNVIPSHATPRTTSAQVEIKNAHKAMFNVFTYDANGDMLHSGNGFFIDEDGTGVAAYSLFKEAHKAVVIDYKGNELKVSRILGASSHYDLVKFSTQGEKEMEAFEIEAHPQVAVGSSLQMVVYTGKKKSKPILSTIESADNFEEYQYYKLSVKNVEKNFGCPIVNEKNRVVGIIQKNVEENATNACAIDARFISTLTITSTSILNSDLNDIQISKGLPATEKDALTFLYMLGTKDSTAAMHAANDFVETYPENAEGYTLRGTIYAQYKNYADCEADFKQALEVVQKGKSTIKEDEIHNNLSKLIYNKSVYAPQADYAEWNLDRAIEEAQTAFQIQPSPFYLLQKGHCYFAQKNYLKAYDCYKSINTDLLSHDAKWSADAKAETWLFAASAYEMNMKTNPQSVSLADSTHMITLLDSAIAAYPKPYTVNNANLFLQRAQRNAAIGQHRKAVMDFYEYEKIIGPKNLTDKFYYLREQAEMKCHMYQQALDDISTAIAFNPNDPLYPIEKAVVLLQVGMYKEAIEICQASLETLPENPDCYKIIGISYGEMKQKKEALKALQKAQELGDPTVQFFIDKYK